MLYSGWREADLGVGLASILPAVKQPLPEDSLRDGRELLVQIIRQRLEHVFALAHRLEVSHDPFEDGRH